MPTLSADQLATFARDGYLVIPNLFTPADVTAINGNLSRLVRESDDQGRHPAPGVSVQFESGRSVAGLGPEQRELAVRKFFQFAPADPFFWTTARDRRIVAILDDLLGPGARLMQSMALVKPPEIGSPKDWHQDVPYFPITPADRCIGIWAAMDDATLENGCMQVVPGSHRLGPVEHIQGPTGWRLPEERVSGFRRDVVPLPVPAGSALVFSACLFHFTDQNRSAKRRRAIQYHYVSADTRWTRDVPGFELANLTAEEPPRLAAMR